MSDVSWTLQALEAFPKTLTAFLDEIPERALDWRPSSWERIPSEQLTIRQQICHLRDIESDGYLVRIQRVLAESEPHLASIDTDALVTERAYDQTDMSEALASFTSARRRTMQLLHTTMPSDLGRTGDFEGYGKVTLSSLVHYLCSHDQQHLAGIQWLLGQHAAAPA